MHLVHPQKFVFNFSWDDCNIQDNSEETMVTEFFFWRGGVEGGATGIMVYVKMVNNKLLDT